MKQKHAEIVSITDDQFQDFSAEELEMRLETDPLFLTNLLNLGGKDDDVMPAARTCKQCEAAGTDYIDNCQCKGLKISLPKV